MTIATSAIRVFRGDDRGASDLGWLKSRHSFAFGAHQDPARRSYGPLRVLNDDTVAPGAGFDEHGHRDMEIISLILEGALEHRDSAGNQETLGPGDVQLMSAGSGIRHAEMNGSATDPVHFLQIWIRPDRAGHEPGHATLRADERQHAGWSAIASGDPQRGGLRIHQDATVSHATINDGEAIEAKLPAGRLGYLHVATGSVQWDGQRLEAGDALEFSGNTTVALSASGPSQLLFFDLPS